MTTANGSTDHRAHPERYRVGKGEQGVFGVEPYRSELAPHWRFANPAVARSSSETIYAMFQRYLADGDLVGADMARKYLQMGYTRARRYARHPGGRKYRGPVPDDLRGVPGAHGREELPQGEEDPLKAEAAAIFKVRWDQAEANSEYTRLRAAHRVAHG